MEPNPRTFRPESLLAHREWVERAARALVYGDGDADDLQQEAWLRVLTRPPPGELASPRGWLWSVLRTTAIDAGRAARTRRRHEEAAARPERLDSSPAELVARAETLNRVARAVLDLEEPYRATMLLRYFEDREPRAVAELQGIPVETVRTRLKRAVARLRARLDAENEGDRGRWCLALLPLLRRPSPGIAATAGLAASAAAGVLLMGIKTKAAVVAAALLLATGGGLLLVRPWEGGVEGDRGHSRVAGVPGAPAPAPPAGGNGAAALPAPAGADLAGGPAPEGAPPPVEGNPVAVPSPPTTAKPADDGTVVVRALGPGGGEGGATLRIVVTDGAGAPRDGVRLQVHAAVDGLSRCVFEGGIGPGGTADVPGIDPAGFPCLTVEAGGWRRQVRPGVLARRVAAGQVTEVAIRMDGCASVEGTVRHAERGPMARAVVRLGNLQVPDSCRTADELTATADEQGRYRFDEVPRGRFEITVGTAVAGHDVVRDVLVVTGPGLLTRDIVVGRATLEGVVRDASTGMPIGGAFLRFGEPARMPWQATSDASGAYRVFDLPPGTYDVLATHDGHVVRWLRSRPVSADTPRLDIDLDPAPVVVFHVRDGAGRPFVGEVLLGFTTDTGAREWTPARTDDTGTVRFAQAPPGRRRLLVGARDFETWRATVDLGTEETSLDVVLAATPAAADGRLATLAGRIVDGSTLHPIPGVLVAGIPGGGHAVTDADGRYRLPGLDPERTESLSLEKDGWGWRSVRIAPPPAGEETTVDATMEPAGTLRIRVVRADGRPFAGRFHLTTRPANRETGTGIQGDVTADGDGWGTWRRSLPGRYSIEVSVEDVGRGTTEVDLALGETPCEVTLE